MKLYELMKKKGYSFSDLAEAADVGRATITRIVYGQGKEPHPGTKRKLAAILGVEISDIDEFNTESAIPEAAEPKASEEGIAEALKAFEAAGGDEEQGDVEREFAQLIAGYKERASA